MGRRKMRHQKIACARRCVNETSVFPTIAFLVAMGSVHGLRSDVCFAKPKISPAPQQKIIESVAQILPPPGHVNVIELDNRIISPVTQQYIEEAIDRSESDGAVALVIKLDTPGGLLESTRGIVKRMMNARVPVVVYVAPSGSRAGSAGVFITLAAHVAAMAPSTNIGAAHPVTAEGGGPVKKLMKRIRDNEKKPEAAKDQKVEEEVVEEERDPMSEKFFNDTVAWVTTIARAR